MRDIADSKISKAADYTGSSGYFYNNPRSAKDREWAPATMKWSSTFTSTSARASFKLRVSNSSAWLGWAAPEGWLWAKITAAALAARAALTVSRGYTLVWVSVPRNGSWNAITLCCASSQRQTKTSYSLLPIAKRR